MNTRSLPAVLLALCLALAITGPPCQSADDDSKKDERRSDAASRRITEEEGPGKNLPADDPAKAGGVMAQASEVGVSGTDAADTLAPPQSDVTPSAEAQAGSVSLSVGAGAEEQDPTLAVCDATGVYGAGGDDTITHSGPQPFRVEALSTASTVDVEVVLFSSGRGEAQTSAISTAAGLLGGEGNDTIRNQGSLHVLSESTSSSGGVAVTDKLLPGDLGDIPFSDTDVLARTETYGIRGDGGNDTIVNAGNLRAGARSDSHSTSVIVDFDIEPGASRAGSSPFAEEEGDPGSISRTVAEAKVTGIAGGAGNDTITSSGRIGPQPGGFKVILNEYAAHSSAVSQSTQVLFDIPVAGFPGTPLELDVASLDTQVEATSVATGISGGAGNDVITHSGSMSYLGADSSAVAHSVAVDIDREEGTQAVDVEVSIQNTQVGVTSSAGFVGIDGGADDDTITNSGLIRSKARSRADSLSVAANVDLSSATPGPPSGLDFTVNLRSLDATVSSEANAAGILGGTGNDTIVNEGSGEQSETIDVTADSDASANIADFTLAGNVIGLDLERSLMDAATTAAASAVGIDGGEGSDTATNRGSIQAKSEADAYTRIGSVTLIGGGNGLVAQASVTDASSSASAEARGMLGGAGADTLRNAAGGLIVVDADSTASREGINANLSGKITGVGAGVAAVDSSVTAIATATGLSGGDGADSVSNAGEVTVTAESEANVLEGAANAVAGTLGISIEGAVADTSATAGASATGLDGGADGDTLRNESDGTITVHALADVGAGAFSANVNGQVSGVGVGVAAVQASVHADAFTAGLDGGEGDDTILNFGTVESTADARLGAVQGSMNLIGQGQGLAVQGSAAHSSARAGAKAVGLAGGAGTDTVRNEAGASLSASAIADAEAATFSANVAGSVSGLGAQGALVDTSTTAESTAIGIAGGEGDNGELANHGEIDVVASSTVQALSGSANGVVAATGGALQGAMAEAGVDVRSTAVGIEGGQGSDVIRAGENSETTVDSKSIGWLSNLSLNVTGAVTGVGGQAALGDASATAAASAVGFDGGEGDDTIAGDGSVTVRASSRLDAASVSGNLAVSTTGAEVQVGLADLSATADASAVGFDGGAGEDAITSDGYLSVQASSDVDANTVTSNVQGVGAGLTAQASVADASATARSTAIGMRGGDGADSIRVSGRAPDTLPDDPFPLYIDLPEDERLARLETLLGALLEGTDVSISALSTADAAATSVNLTGFNAGGSVQGSVANASTVAQADARGIDGGSDDDTIENTANFVVTSLAFTNAVSTTADLQIALGGSVSQADVTALSDSEATAIDSGDGDDSITNSGNLWAQANSGTTTASWDTELDLTGVSSASTGANAVAKTTGIGAGAGDDTVKTLAGSLTVAHSQATTESSSGHLSFTLHSATSQTATVQASTDATGIEAGQGDDVVVAAGDMLVRSAATTESGSTELKLSGSGTNTAELRADAVATGIHGGEGADEIRNDGVLIVEAQADATARAVKAKAISTGMNRIELETFAEASAVGIEGGKDGLPLEEPGSLAQSIVNTGELAVLASATGTSTGGSSEWFANPLETKTLAEGSADAKAMAVGIRSLEGHNYIRNEGTVAVASFANTSVSARTDALVGANSSRAYSGKESVAYGIVSGTGDDTIESTGTILVGAEAGSTDQTSSDSALGKTSAISTGEARSKAVGIQDWGGTSKIDLGETSVLGVKAFTYVDVQARSDETYIAEAGGWSEARGIVTEEGGDDFIHNRGTIAVSASTHVKAIAADVDKKYEHRATVTYAHTIATGMRTYGGDDRIVNDGTLTVTADTTYVGSPTGSRPSSFALGIDTGSGDDTVINRGTIFTATALQGVRGESIAIDTGSGDDTVILADGSVTTGDIELDSGDDTLVLQGSAKLVGDIYGGAGAHDTLALENMHEVCVFEHMPEDMEHVQLNDTTVWVMQGSLTMDQAGSCRTTLNSAGRTGQLDLLSPGATLTVDGDIEVEAAPWAYANGDTFDVFLAQDVNMAAGWDPADRLTLPESTPLVSFDAGHTTDATMPGPVNIPIPAEAYRVTAHVKPFASVADTKIERAVAAALDATSPAAASDLSNVMGSIQLAAASQYDQAFSSLSPDLYDGMTRASMDAIRLESGVVEHRLDLARSAASFVTPGETPSTGTTSSTAGGAAAAGAVALGNGAWLAGVGQSGSQDSAGGYAGYDFDTSGFALGYERAIENKMIGGTLVSLGNTADFKAGRGTGDVDSLSGTVYGGFFPRKWFVQGALSYSGLSYGMQRGVQVADLDPRQARGEYDGSAISALASGGLAFDGSNWRLEPMASLWFASLSQDSFAETGAGDAGLVFDSRTTQSLVSDLGVRFEGNFWTKGGSRLMPEVALLGSYDFGIDEGTLDAGLVGGTGAPIVLEGQEVDSTGVTVGIGFSFVGRRGLGASIRYNRRVRGDWGANMLVVDLGYRF